jgi:hypothetical protein
MLGKHILTNQSQPIACTGTTKRVHLYVRARSFCMRLVSEDEGRRAGLEPSLHQAAGIDTAWRVYIKLPQGGERPFSKRI